MLAIGESLVTAFGGADNPAVEESVSASLQAARSESIGFSESVTYEVVDNSPVEPEPVEPEPVEPEPVEPEPVEPEPVEPEPVEPEPVEPEPVEIESTDDDNDDDGDDPDPNERKSPEERIEEKEKVETRPEYIEEVRTPSPVSEAVEPLEANLVRVFHLDQLKNEWTFFDPRAKFDEKNTLTQLVPGEIYWLKLNQTQAVNLNGAQRHHLNKGWNRVLW